MKKYLYKSLTLLLIAVFVISMICLIFSGTDLMPVFADSEYSQDYTELTDEQLDDLTARTTESDDASQITVFTHGYGGNAGHWSNDLSAGGSGKFAYESDSMIEQLRESIEAKDKPVTMFMVTVGENNVNTEKTTVEESQSEILDTALTGEVGSAQLRCVYSDDSFITKKEVILYRNDSKHYDIEDEDNMEKYLTSEDVSKHIILVFEAEESERSNDYVYAQFEYILDVISYQYCQLTGTLPTYNLIGHSRGGITNMQYAMAHPYNVATLYSMGTPYNGSSFGEATAFGNHLFLEVADIHKTEEYYTDDNDYPPGVLDIINYDLNESYKSFWNTYYDEWYSHIEFRPIGSYVTLGFVLQTLAEFLNSKGWLDESLGAELAAATELVVNAVGSVIIVKNASNYLLTLLIDKILDIVVDAIPNAPPWIKIINNLSFSRAPYDHLGTSFQDVLAYEDDLFIDLNSQVAAGYEGAQAKVRLMDSIDQVYGKKSVDNIGVGHNFETHQKNIINYVVGSILADIDLSDNDIFRVRYQGENFEECVITRAQTDGATILSIPEEIDGKKVVGIESLSENVLIGEDSINSENTNLQTVIIPDTVKYIGKAAFCGMKNLEEIQLGSGSQLERIESYAFMGSGLSGTITLPNTVNFIDGFAFAYCTGITDFVANGSSVYATDGVLYSSGNGNVELVQYPSGKADASFAIPSEVGVIGTGAFVGNEDITTVDLGHSLHRIGFSAFGSCTDLSMFENGENVGFAELGAFEGTKWITGDAEELSVGSVLVKYNGSKSRYVLPYKYTAIYMMAFSESSVQDLIIINTNQIVSVCDFAIEEDIKVKVPNGMLSEYQSNTQWNDLKIEISPIQSHVEFDSDGGTAVESKTVYYGDYLNFEVPTKEGYIFLGWRCNGVLITNESGNAFEMWDYYEDVTLTAEWRPESYIIKLVLENEDELWLEAENGIIDLSDILTEIQYGEEIGYSFSERLLDILKNDKSYNVPGKIITGFMINGEIIDWDDFYVLPDLGDEIELEIELIYEDEIYEITFITNSEEGTYTAEYTYDEIIDYPDLESTYDRTFKAWYYDAQFEDPFNYARMPDLTPDSEGTGSIIIYAEWIEIYEISFNANGGTECDSIRAEEGEVITLPTSTRTGYDGTWGEYEFGEDFTVTGSMTLVAEWTGKYYTITFNNNGGYGGTVSAKVQFNGSMPDIDFPTREGHKLDYFYDSKGNQYYVNGEYEEKAYTLTGNLALTAQWSEAFLTIENLGFDGGWKIRVTNTSSTTITVDYNKKMCFLGDAQKWTGLKDTEDFDLAPGESKILDGDEVIKENWFATSVTFSYVANNYRYITYANELDTDCTMTVYHNRIIA